MKCANAVLAAMLMLTACATPSPRAGNSDAAPTPNAASGCPVATPDGATPEMGLEAKVILGCLPAKPAAGPSLNVRYADKAAFLAALQSLRPGTAITLDGKGVWDGFGPGLQYRTNPDGSVSR